LVVECKIRKFLDIFKVFYRFFVKEIIKDFCWIFAPDFCGFFGEFLHRVFGRFLSATAF
jgi:hypothetical protein